MISTSPRSQSGQRFYVGAPGAASGRGFRESGARPDDGLAKVWRRCGEGPAAYNLGVLPGVSVTPVTPGKSTGLLRTA